MARRGLLHSPPCPSRSVGLASGWIILALGMSQDEGPVTEISATVKQNAFSSRTAKYYRHRSQKKSLQAKPHSLQIQVQNPGPMTTAPIAWSIATATSSSVVIRVSREASERALMILRTISIDRREVDGWMD
jgi:hypothetical protein